MTRIKQLFHNKPAVLVLVVILLTGATLLAIVIKNTVNSDSDSNNDDSSESTTSVVSSSAESITSTTSTTVESEPANHSTKVFNTSRTLNITIQTSTDLTVEADANGGVNVSTPQATINLNIPMSGYPFTDKASFDASGSSVESVLLDLFNVNAYRVTEPSGNPTVRYTDDFADQGQSYKIGYLFQGIGYFCSNYTDISACDNIMKNIKVEITSEEKTPYVPSS